MEARMGTPDAEPALGAVSQSGTVASGAVSGLVGGVAMAAFMVVAALATGMAELHALDVLGDTFVGLERLEGMAEIAFGAAIHLLVAVVAGLAFAAVVPRDLPPTCAVMVGMGYALFLAGFMASVVLPVVNPTFRDGMQPLGGSWVIGTVLYGAALGWLYAFAGRRTRGRAPGR